MSSIIIAGGFNAETSITDIEVLTGNLESKQIKHLPHKINGFSMVQHNGTILICGGKHNLQKCLQLDQGTWKWHSTLNKERCFHSVVATQEATFLFGGMNSKATYEYLPKDSKTWLMGKSEIPEGFEEGCAIPLKSGQEILLMGGFKTEKRVLIFNVTDHSFKVSPLQLNYGRIGHRCCYIPNTKKIMITGGAYTEILDTKNGSVTIASPMKSNRNNHGMGIITNNGEDRLAVFGGYDGLNLTYLDSVEIYNNMKEKWETSNIKLKGKKLAFGFLTIKLGDVNWNSERADHSEVERNIAP